MSPTTEQNSDFNYLNSKIHLFVNPFNMQLATASVDPTCRPLPVPFLQGQAFYLNDQGQMKLLAHENLERLTLQPKRDYGTTGHIQYIPKGDNGRCIMKARVVFIDDEHKKARKVYMMTPWTRLLKFKRHNVATKQFGHSAIVNSHYHYGGEHVDTPQAFMNEYTETLETICATVERESGLPLAPMNTLQPWKNNQDGDYYVYTIPTEFKGNTSNVRHTKVTYNDRLPFLKGDYEDEKEFYALENNIPYQVAFLHTIEVSAWMYPPQSTVSISPTIYEEKKLINGISYSLMAERVFSAPREEWRNKSQQAGLEKFIADCEDNMSQYWNQQLTIFYTAIQAQKKKRRKPKKAPTTSSSSSSSSSSTSTSTSNKRVKTQPRPVPTSSQMSDQAYQPTAELREFMKNPDAMDSPYEDSD